MIMDRQNTVSNDQAITATAVSTDTIDLSQNRDIGIGHDLAWVITVTEAFNNLTSLTVQVISASTADLGTNQTILIQTDAIVLAQLTAGRRPIVIRMPRHILSSQPIGQRYIGLRYVVAGSAPTTGKVTAGLVLDAQSIARIYPSGYSIT